MSIELITLLLVVSILVILALGLPVVFAIGGVAIAFTWIVWGSNGLSMVAAATWGIMQAWVILAAPLFIFMAIILERSGVADDLYQMLYIWLGGLRGGLAIGTVFICTLFAAMVGVVSAATVTMGLIALPSMLKRRYDKRIAIGSIAAGGALGQLIPPSIDLIIYGIYTQESIGRLFAAGVIPGLLLSAIYCIYIAIRCVVQPSVGPAVPAEEKADWGEKLRSLKAVVLPVLLILSVLGVIFLGIATPTEAAAIGALGSLIVAAINRRLNWGIIREACQTTLKFTCMVAWIMIGATCFSILYQGIGAADLVQKMVVAIPGGRWGVLIGMQMTFFIMGMFIDDIPIIMIMAPIYLPIVKTLGFDTIWYAILFMVNMQMAYLTPPFGLVLFYMKAVLPDGLTLTDVYRSIWPFVILQAIGLILIMMFPQIALWLPSIIMK